MAEEQIQCMYCQGDGKCPTCEGDGYLIAEQNVPPYEYHVMCEDCVGTGACQVCGVRAEQRLIGRNGTQ